jgi:hypothetical protein
MPDMRRRTLALWQHRIKMDDLDIATQKTLGAPSYPQPDDTHRQQQAQIRQVAIARRMAQHAHEGGVGFLDLEAAAAAAKRLPQQIIHTPPQPVPAGGWLG